MVVKWTKALRFERCPRCSGVVTFAKGENGAVCRTCGARIKLKAKK
ncbi:MAG: hypothetical protein V1794_00855 [Candidatus Glassbacteria bacterium]